MLKTGGELRGFQVGELLTQKMSTRAQGRWREGGGEVGWRGGGCLPRLGASLCREDLTGTSGRERAPTEGEESREDAHSVLLGDRMIFHPTATFLDIV